MSAEVVKESITKPQVFGNSGHASNCQFTRTIKVVLVATSVGNLGISAAGYVEHTLKSSCNFSVLSGKEIVGVCCTSVEIDLIIINVVQKGVRIV